MNPADTGRKLNRKRKRMNKAKVIGAGLAGSEAAWQLAQRGIEVELLEMKPEKMTPAHRSPDFAELVCSNSLRSDRLSNAVGLLKEEMRRFDSLILSAADHNRVPAGGALAVDRVGFSREVTDRIRSNPRIHVISEEVTEIPDPPVIIATGPLTSDGLTNAIHDLPGLKTLNFYDAAAPIVTKESLDFSKVYRMSRYGRGDDYLNCPMDEEEYNAFIDALIEAETADIHGFEETGVFEGCMPIESMARRGRMVPAFGPMKPVGLKQEGKKLPFAVVQLRQDDAADTLYNLVGFQTRLRFPEQRRVFGLIPGLEHAEFARYGVMHRNTFLNSPGFLNSRFEMISRPGCYFSGQMTGVEGYVESAASGLVAGVSLARQLLGLSSVDFPGFTALGAMGRYIAANNAHFQPMNCSFGLIDPLPEENGKKRIRDKQLRYEAVSARSLQYWKEHEAEIREGIKDEQPV